MSKNTKISVIYRCPICYNYGNDVYLNDDNGELYCLRCSFAGSIADVENMYDAYRKRYKRMFDRVTLQEQRNM